MTERSSVYVTASEAKIIKQIEYYFGDFNLLRDTFLQEQIQKDDGWVTMDTMLTFNRLKEITDSAQMICEALKKSSSGLMEVSELGDKIRRSPSKTLTGDTKKTRKNIIARTVFAKPFPLDVNLDDLQEFFEGYGQVDNVFMKRHFQKKTFKGCVFVTFANKEDAIKFVNEEETKFKEQALEVKSFNYYKHKEEETEADIEDKVREMMTKNTVLHLSGLNSKTSIEQVKRFFSKYAEVVWVDIVKDAAECYIRFREPGSAGSTLEKAKSANYGKIVIQGSVIEVRVVEGDEELQYWKRMFKNIADMKKGGSRDSRHGEINERGGLYQRDLQKYRGGPQIQNKKENSNGEGSDGEEQDTEEEDAEKPSAKVIKSELVIKFQEVLNFKDASCDGEEQDTEEQPVTLSKSEMVITGPQSKRKQSKKIASSDLGERDTGEPPAKVIKSEMIIKFEEVLSFKDVSSDGEEQDMKEQPNTVIKSEMVLKFQEVMKLEDASSSINEKDTDEPTVKVTKSTEVITRPQIKMKQNKNNASRHEEERNTEEPPAKVAKYEKAITRPQGRIRQNKKHASSDVEKQDTVEPPARIIESEMIITRSHAKRKQKKKQTLYDGEDQDTEEPPAKVIKSEIIITRSLGKRKQNKKHVSRYGEEQDLEEPPVKVIKSEMIITRSQGHRKQKEKDALTDGEYQGTEGPSA